jgi:hypothetical protein
MARKTAAGVGADGRFYSILRCKPYLGHKPYLGYLNSGASFSASFVVFIVARHLLSLLS